MELRQLNHSVAIAEEQLHARRRAAVGVQPTDFEHASRLTGEALAACRKLLAARPVLALAA